MEQLNTGETLAPDTKPVFCIDCRHMRKVPKDHATCAAPGARMTNLVTGYYEPRCDQQRRPHQECGQFGLLFESVDAPSKDELDATRPTKKLFTAESRALSPACPSAAATAAPSDAREPYARISSLEHNRRALQSRCHAALEDITEAVESHGADSPQAQTVKARYVRSLTSDPIPFLEEAVKSLDRDHAWPRHA